MPPFSPALWLCTCSWSSLHTAEGSQGGQKAPWPSNIKDMCPDRWLLFLIKCAKWAAIVAQPPLSLASPPPNEMTSQGFKELALFFFFSFGDEALKTRTFKKPQPTWKKLASDHAGQGRGSQKTWEDMKFTTQADSGHRDNLQQSKQATHKQ